MSGSAIVMMIVGMVVIWGGLLVSIGYSKKASKKN
jgi:hypothetical protein